MFIRKCSIQLIRDVSGITPSSARMLQPLGQNQTFTVHTRPMIHMLFETCAREELNKFKVYVDAAGGKRFKFEDQPSFLSLSGCSTTVHLLDQRRFHVLDVAVVGQIKVLGQGKTSSMIVVITIVSLHRPKVLTKTVRKFTAGFSSVQHVTSLAKDCIDHAGGSTIEPPIEENTSTHGSYRISLRREVTGATPGMVRLHENVPGGAWSCSGREAKVLWTKMSRRLVSRRWTHKGWLLNMCAVVGSSLKMWKFVGSIFLASWLLGWKLSTRGTRSLATVFAVTFAESSFPAYFLCSLQASSN